MTIWKPVEDELAKWDQASLPARLWLRDDDAIEPTVAIEKLISVTKQFDVPVAIAVIPKFATNALAEITACEELVSVALHGHSHSNHAPPDQKKCELGLHRGKQNVLGELANGKRKLEKMFGDRFINMLVPPWNRIDPQLVPELAGLGLTGLSTFGWKNFSQQAGLVQHNTHVDIIDWRGNRGGRPVAALVSELASALGEARFRGGEPVGILSHHLVHDHLAWAFLEQLFKTFHQENRIQWCHAASLV